MNKRVGVLMGGTSCERDISIKSGQAVCCALERNKVKVVPLELKRASTINGYRKIVEETIRSSNIDIAFIALHGKFGEDGKIQEILRDMNIPYTGSRVDASKLGMDKIVSKVLFEANNIPVPRYKVIEDRVSPTRWCTVSKELHSPLVIKPCDEGSSIGISIVDSESSFDRAISHAFSYSDKVLVEEYVPGSEITVGILEDKPLPIVEIIPKIKFFDFEAKYKKGLTEYKVPARLAQEKYDTCQKLAVLAHRALGALFFSRVDMILSEEGIPNVLEVNTIPGLMETSLLPKAALAAGIDFDQLVFKILDSAKHELPRMKSRITTNKNI